MSFVQSCLWPVSDRSEHPTQIFQFLVYYPTVALRICSASALGQLAGFPGWSPRNKHIGTIPMATKLCPGPWGSPFVPKGLTQASGPKGFTNPPNSRLSLASEPWRWRHLGMRGDGMEG